MEVPFLPRTMPPNAGGGLSTRVALPPTEIAWRRLELEATPQPRVTDDVPVKFTARSAVWSRAMMHWGPLSTPAPVARAVTSTGCMPRAPKRSEEHTSELQSLMRISYAVFFLKKKQTTLNKPHTDINNNRCNS